ncbi:uncharacterized protein LOC123665046 [Melitaea cinxia]|uniref:uncharacterized protein LOC123665046 n=1 Tax=Melitaea cinxia TaxID=113334 RepID=UPI001E27061E|nr:uncharacterized protein LOC123665046 [Melitaea cinxia]
MTEAHIGFLYNAASVFKLNELDETHKKLKSYYLIRCKEVTRGYGLPKKHFSEQSRCSYCCLEWDNKSEIKLKPIKLSKRQRRRIKYNSKHKTTSKKESLLFSNEMEKICSFCGKTIKTPLIKPNKLIKQTTEQSITITDKGNLAQDVKKPKNKKVKHKPEQKHQSNVYCKSKVAFSLNKQKNSLQNSVKVEPKIIKNSKKKKDKFAGLCQKAVIASTKFKQEKENNSKLSLFLKPST